MDGQPPDELVLAKVGSIFTMGQTSDPSLAWKKADFF